MSQLVYVLISVSLAALVFLTVVDLIAGWNTRRAALLAGIVILAFLALYFATGYPFQTKVAYGGLDNVVTIALIYLGVLVGMGCQYFYTRADNVKFSPRGFLKPLFVSPIVLLPLIDIIQKTQDATATEYVTMIILGFQNGFFWRTVLNDAAARKDAT